MNYAELGYFRAAAVAPPLQLAHPSGNAERHIFEIRELAAEHVSLALFPELSLTGFSVDDLFHDRTLLEAARLALRQVAEATAGSELVAVLGAPLRVADGRLFNCAFVLGQGRVLGAVPKIELPNYGEFYDQRWFASGRDVHLEIDDELGSFVLDAKQLFEIGGVAVGIEICEDLWAVRPSGAELALGGAQLIVNPSASNELVAKADYRRDLVRMASATRLCGYLYASAGPLESTRDAVFGGHLLAAENGVTLGEGTRFALHGERLLVDFDIERIDHDRAFNSTFAKAPRAPLPARRVAVKRVQQSLLRDYPRRPFVPDDEHELEARAKEILAIQATGLARRALAARAERLVIGLSGGLDSTLAFLVCCDAVDLMERQPRDVLAVTMPGPGTSAHTLESARRLAECAGAELLEIPIHAAVTQHLEDLGHPQDEHDVVFENAQARERTQLLFNLANQRAGIVVGTGDLSELALGWCTFNADQTANYNVNAGVPKTLIAYLVRWYARHRAPDALAALLERVLDTPISPELVPSSGAEVGQRTEEIIGPYELHDFFLFHLVRGGSPPRKIYALARRAFPELQAGEIRTWLEVFFLRFFAQQFKRTTLPPGPKVGTVSLSPRGDWRMPDEVAAESWLAEIRSLDG